MCYNFNTFQGISNHEKKHTVIWTSTCIPACLQTSQEHKQLHWVHADRILHPQHTGRAPWRRWEFVFRAWAQWEISCTFHQTTFKSKNHAYLPASMFKHFLSWALYIVICLISKLSHCCESSASSMVTSSTVSWNLAWKEIAPLKSGLILLLISLSISLL